MGERPRILWLARMLPLPLQSGDRIYTARLVEALAAAGGDVHYLGLANPDVPDLDGRALSAAVRWEIVPGPPRGILAALASRRPLVGARFGTRAYADRLTALLGEETWDAVVLDQYGLAWALPLVARLAPHATIVHVAHDFETEVTAGIAAATRGNPLRRAVLKRNARRTAAAERALALAAGLLVTLTEHDAALFRAIGARGATAVVPPGYDGPRRTTRRIDPASPRRVGIVGSFQWIAKQMNLAAFLGEADAIFAQAGIELAVAGEVPGAFRAEWEGRLRATRLLGFVDDLPAFLDECRMGLVVEAVGGGFKLKVLDYVMTRTPVAALAPALGGQLEAMTRHFLVADDGAALARGVAAAIDDLERLHAMQEGAFVAAAARHDWGENGRALLAAIEAART